MTTSNPEDRKGLCLTLHRGQRTYFEVGGEKFYIYLKSSVKNIEMIIVARDQVDITRSKEYGARGTDREAYENHLSAASANHHAKWNKGYRNDPKDV